MQNFVFIYNFDLKSRVPAFYVTYNGNKTTQYA